MVALVRSRGLDLSDDTPASAREAIKALLANEPKSTRRIYGAFLHKVWSLLVERRFDEEVRDWHELLHSLKVHFRGQDDVASERLTALADLLRESVSLSETSPAREVAKRPQATRILQSLWADGGYVSRQQLLQSLGIGGSHLSNILTQLLAHSLIERRENGREAAFRLAPLGRQILQGESQIQSQMAIETIFADAFVHADAFQRIASAIDKVQLVNARSIYELQVHRGAGDASFPVVRMSEPVNLFDDKPKLPQSLFPIKTTSAKQHPL